MKEAVTNRRILVVDDDRDTSESLAESLDLLGYEVAVVHTGEEAIELARARVFDVIILDMVLPRMTGQDVLDVLLEQGEPPRVIMVSGLGSERTVARMLRAGADDYVRKPISIHELSARIDVLLERYPRQKLSAPHPVEPHAVTLGDCQVSLRDFTVRRGDEVMPLTLTEARLFDFLYTHRGQAVTRDAINDSLWGGERRADRHIDNYVMRLRRKLEADPGVNEILKTVRGVGYLLDV